MELQFNKFAKSYQISSFSSDSCRYYLNLGGELHVDTEMCSNIRRKQTILSQ
jgi:hypothetical protein